MAELLNNFFYLHSNVENFSNIQSNNYNQFSNCNQSKESFYNVEHLNPVYNEDAGIQSFYDTDNDNEEVFDFKIYEEAQIIVNTTTASANKAREDADTAGKALTDFLDGGGDKLSEKGKTLVNKAKDASYNSTEAAKKLAVWTEYALQVSQKYLIKIVDITGNVLYDADENKIDFAKWGGGAVYRKNGASLEEIVDLGEYVENKFKNLGEGVVDLGIYVGKTLTKSLYSFDGKLVDLATWNGGKFHDAGGRVIDGLEYSGSELVATGGKVIDLTKYTGITVGSYVGGVLKDSVGNVIDLSEYAGGTLTNNIDGNVIRLGSYTASKVYDAAGNLVDLTKYVNGATFDGLRLVHGKIVDGADNVADGFNYVGGSLSSAGGKIYDASGKSISLVGATLTSLTNMKVSNIKYVDGIFFDGSGDVFDLADYAGGTLRDSTGKTISNIKYGGGAVIGRVIDFTGGAGQTVYNAAGEAVNLAQYAGGKSIDGVRYVSGKLVDSTGNVLNGFTYVGGSIKKSALSSIIGSYNSAGRAKDTATASLKRSKEFLGTVAANAYDSVVDAKKWVGGKLEGLGDNAVDVGTYMSESIYSGVKNTRDAAKRALSGAASAAVDVASGATSAAVDVASGAASAAVDVASGAASAAVDVSSAAASAAVNATSAGLYSTTKILLIVLKIPILFFELLMDTSKFTGENIIELFKEFINNPLYAVGVAVFFIAILILTGSKF